MQALILTKSGHPSENFNLVNDFPKPDAPGKGDLLVKIHATALNPVDYKQAQYGFLISGFPVVLGCDLAGTVVAVGEGVTRFKVGDTVCGFPTIRAGYGTYAQYNYMTEYSAIHKPANWSFEQASTIGVGGYTAGEALYRYLKLPFQADPAHPVTVLIWGGSGSVGAYAVQLARQSGFTVIATAGARNAEFVKSLGAHHVIDHSDPNVVEKIVQAAGGHLTYALDTISSETAAKCVAALKTDAPAFLHTIAGTPKEAPANVTVTSGLLAGCVGNVEVESFLAKFSIHLETVVAAGAIKPNEVQLLENGLAGVPHGLQLLADGQVSGKKLVATVSH